MAPLSSLINSLLLLLLLLLTTLSSSTDLTLHQPSLRFVPTPHPQPGAQSNSAELLSLFSRLGRSTSWTLVSATPLEGDTGEPEGMVILRTPSGDISRVFLAAGEWTVPTESFTPPNQPRVIINGTDRANGEGYAHIIVYDGQGRMIADATLTETGEEEYHIGGLEYDGENMWATLSEYRPNSTATVIRLDPKTLEYERVVRVGDHLGGIVHDVKNERITCLNWGSRNATYFDLKRLGEEVEEERVGVAGRFVRPEKVVRNPSFYVDYQDCKFLGHHSLTPFTTIFAYHDEKEERALMICSGVATLPQPNNVTIGGIAVVDVETMIPVMEVPLSMESELGARITQNPFDVAVVGGRLRVYFMPDEHNSTLFEYEAELESAFQYGGDGGL